MASGGHRLRRLTAIFNSTDCVSPAAVTAMAGAGRKSQRQERLDARARLHEAIQPAEGVKRV